MGVPIYVVSASLVVGLTVRRVLRAVKVEPWGVCFWPGTAAVVVAELIIILVFALRHHGAERYPACVRELAESIERWRDRGDRIALATVVATRRSAPRPVGAELIVSEQGELFGSVSGGCVESDVAVQAAEVIEDGSRAN